MRTQLQFIEEMCGILHEMARVIEGQQRKLAHYNALAMVEEYDHAKVRYTELLGRDEWPDEAEEPEEE
ncbi:MAG: hypothetical protein NC311_08205 [Muribaculaceae bacterium]|nr:hypothetical protein [Muribaculaceae bacterium]MCM1439318.1 hypothetical protein [Roseburia sp.]